MQGLTSSKRKKDNIIAKKKVSMIKPDYLTDTKGCQYNIIHNELTIRRQLI